MFLSLLAAAALARPAGTPPLRVDYERQVHPLLVAHCYACHGNGLRLGGLSLESRSAMLRGGNTGAAIVPGNSGASLLVQLVSGHDPARIMPARGRRLTQAEIDTLSAWILQGAAFGAAPQADDWVPPMQLVSPRVPAWTSKAPYSNPIDRLLAPWFSSRRIVPGKAVADAIYLRRASLDTVGLLPTPADAAAFARDRSGQRRTHLVERLLARRRDYAVHWMTFWNDLLRNDYAGTGYIDGGRTQITAWLFRALYGNMPFDAFVRDLVSPNADTEGFLNGIVWRGVVNASQTPQMQAAQNVSQVFLGVNLKCASCHDSFISTWKLRDAYAMAGIFADGPLETVHCDKPTGEFAPIQFIYPSLGKINPKAGRPERERQLAAILTCPQDGRLARTFVNRVWTRLMGRGLVEPNDDMDRRPWDPPLLDWLAADFVAHHYDVQHLLLTIETSRAYQLPSAPQDPDHPTQFTFHGPLVRRLDAEQFSDAVSQLTGVWQQPAIPLDIAAGVPLPPPGARIVYESPVLRRGSVAVDVAVAAGDALMLVATDGGDDANLDWTDWIDPRFVGASAGVPVQSLKPVVATTGYGEIQKDRNVIGKPLRVDGVVRPHGIGTHANSVLGYIVPPGVARFQATAGPDNGATDQPKSPTSIRICVVEGPASMLNARAAQAYSNALMTAMNRPNRDQVVTERASVSTTLQALEMTNGGTLDSMLRSGAAMWLADGHGSPTRIVSGIWHAALGRSPTPAEQRTALSMLRTTPSVPEVQDLLWAVVMLPEFQLEY